MKYDSGIVRHTGDYNPIEAFTRTAGLLLWITEPRTIIILNVESR